MRGLYNLRMFNPNEVKTERRNRRRRGGPLAAVSTGVFLIILAVVSWRATYNTNLASQIVDYFKSFETYGRPVLPPVHLLSPVAEFALYFGVWLIILAALRIGLRICVWSAPGDLAGGIFLFVNYMILDFTQNGKSIAMLLPIGLIGLGVVVMVGGIAGALIRRRTAE